MFHKVVLCILILSCFSLSSFSGEKDERIEEREEQLKEEVKEAEAEGTAVPAGICDRTMPVQKALLEKAEKKDCVQITNQDLQAIVALDILDNNITQLKANDFSGLTSLELLNLSGNQLESLPEGIFSGLTSLQGLDLSGNKLASLPEGSLFQSDFFRVA